MEGRRPVGRKANGNACSGLRAGAACHGSCPPARHSLKAHALGIAFDFRQEPGAGKPHAGICGGGVGQPTPLPDNLFQNAL